MTEVNKQSNTEEELQELRGCFKCIFFDRSRRGKSRACTYAFKIIFEGEYLEICYRPSTNQRGPRLE